MNRNTNIFLLLVVLPSLLLSCSPTQKISRQTRQELLSQAPLAAAHLGISIYDAETNTYLYNYQGDKYFVPASNIKIPTCYAAMKYLGDSLAGWWLKDSANTLFIKANGDPTFLHPAFRQQRFFDLLKTTDKKISREIFTPQFERFGNGWAWNDYEGAYMAERSVSPIYGGVVNFKMEGNNLNIQPRYFSSPNFSPSYQEHGKQFVIRRNKNLNSFYVEKSNTPFSSRQIPFTGANNGNLEDILLIDTLKSLKKDFLLNYHSSSPNIGYKKYYTQATDSLLKPMMHNSDNFFAEQALLMVSSEKLGAMNDEKIIDTLLKVDLNDLPQKPRWADGSGLSRYNLFSPQDFVVILNKMKNEFGMARIKEIFPTGGEGTLSSFYKNDSSFIYAKTGTLSGVVALSGFLYTQKSRLLIFSILVNNHTGSAMPVRRAVEAYLQKIRRDN